MEPGIELGSICFFTQHGKTFTFKGVTLLTDNETMIVFDYQAVSDKLMKRAVFQKSQICGWSSTPK